MELNSVKDYLNRANYSELRINAKLALKEEFKVQSSNIACGRDLIRPSLRTGAPSPEGEGKAPAGAAAERMAELQEEIDRELGELAEQKLKIMQLIRRVSKPESQTVLELRYLKGWSWKRIAMNMHYSVTHVCRLHKAALKEISEFRKDV